MPKPTKHKKKSKSSKSIKSTSIVVADQKHQSMDVEEDEIDENIDIADDNEERSVIPEASAYVPGRSRPLMDDEELVMDRSAYRLFFDLQVESPSLSFDILVDNFGYDRAVEVNGPAISASIVCGTQAAQGYKNNLVVMRMTNLLPFRKKVCFIPSLFCFCFK